MIISEPLKITDLSASGCGVARGSCGRVYFVRGAVPGDELTCRVQSHRSSYSRGVIQDLLHPSPYRKLKVPCSVYGRCGGCTWMDVAYEQQLHWKRDILRQALRKHLPAELVGGEQIVLQPSSSVWGYRSRMQLRVHVHAGKVEVGFFAPATHTLVPFATCPILTPHLESWLQHLRSFPAPATASYKVVLAVQEMHDDAASATAQLPVGIVVGARSPKDVDLSDFMQWMHEVAFSVVSRGEEAPLALWDRDHGVDYWGSHSSFFQCHKAGNAQLRSSLMKRACDELGVRSAYDMYAGSGNFSLALMARGIEVVGVEESSAAVRGAERSREHIVRCWKGGVAERGQYRCLKAECDARRRFEEKEQFDLVLLNPPRGGVKKALPYAAGLAQRHLFYVSCYPLSLAADLGKLYRSGFFQSIAAIQIFDFYPHSSHFETWVHLVRQG